MHQLFLGAEHDAALLQRLRDAIQRLGGSVRDREWAVGGSQEVTTFEIELPDGRLEAIAETYVGLSLKGPEALVARVAREAQV